MRKRVAVGALALALGLAAAPLTAIGAQQPAQYQKAAAQAGKVIWEDNFDGSAGQRVNSSKWNTETGDNFGNNREHQYYTDSAGNAALDGSGNLVITAKKENPANYNCWYGRCQYTSARINTSGKFTTTYGKVEARMKLPRGKGIWPAFWMLGQDIGSNPWPNSGEIDIMEFLGHEQNKVYGTIHGPGYSGAGGVGGSYTGPNFADGFHTFAVEWAPNSIKWLVDGNVFFQTTPASVNGNRWVFDKPFFVILNLAVGGEWPGYPDASTQFPQQMLVDYVRVTDTSGDNGGGGGGGNPGVVKSGRVTGLGGKCLDVPWANSASGTPIQVVSCNGNAAQNWTFYTDGSIRALGKCLDVSNSGKADGTVIQLWDCNGTGAQKWAVSGANDVVNINADKCLDIKGNTSADGTRVQLWTCTGAANQKWNAFV
ncbi:family 16 glycosylhydrolase [Actinosynnema pretiosum subsp. pretiosum]|uniref:Glycoside hydrolase family 16 n=2 Tax=Actinosynnema TaxID=40566 RepID=C6W969_ACTMD|nr:glycoside hydrolase family 16 protein [Actinosynnema mirum]ACU39141.1 glycoside hydrolase family 16 [Actinosynnema mirum DSM 43827]QUF03382.1 family 16 glycosylhydrolase [Actinosynnema pretiosum subsp. pretiosum]